MSGRPKRNGPANAGPFCIASARLSQGVRKTFASSRQDFRKSKQALLLAKYLPTTCLLLAKHLPNTCQTLAKHLPNTCEILAKQHHSAYYHQHHSVRLRRYEDASLAYTASNRHASGTTQCASDITSLRCSGITTLLGFAAGMVLPAPGGAAHLSEMLPLPARTSPPTRSLGEAERTQCN